MLTPRTPRAAFTLVELLVVITIILIVTAIGVLAIPSASDRAMQQGADKLQGWLLIAKQRAKRDGLPTGLRIVFDPATNRATQCVYVQQPDDYDVPGTSCSGVGNTTVHFFNGTNATVNLQQAGVQPGDYLEVYRGGGVYQITAVTGARALTIATTGPNCQSATSNPAGRTTEYRIRRQPIPLAGEEALELPEGVVIDQAKSRNVSMRTAGGATYYEVMFSPQGGLVGRGSGSDQVCVLWLLNTRNPTVEALLLAIQAHTGFIAVQPDGGAADPYKYCRDARSSGL